MSWEYSYYTTDANKQRVIHDSLKDAHYVLAKDKMYRGKVGKNYAGFETIEEVSQFLGKQKNNLHYYEVLFSDTPVKLYFDIEKQDVEIEGDFNIKNFRKDIRKYIEDVHKEEKVTTAYFNSSRPEKISYHLIVRSHQVKNPRQARVFVEHFCNKYPQYRNWIDTSVYKKLQCFRCMNSSKFNTDHFLKLESEHNKFTVKDSLILDGAKKTIDVEPIEIEVFSTVNRLTTNDDEYKELKETLEAINSDYDIKIFNQGGYTYVDYDHTKNCLVNPKEKHEHILAYIFKKNNKFSLGCFSEKCKGKTAKLTMKSNFQNMSQSIIKILTPLQFRFTNETGCEHIYRSEKELITAIQHKYGKDAIKTFLDSKEIKVYDKKIIDPSTEEREVNGCLNIWKGFSYTYDPNYVVNEELLKPFKRLLKIITNNEKCNVSPSEYIEDFLAYKLQYPHRNPQITLFFCGENGTGKGTFNRVIKKLFGGEYTNNLDFDEVFSSFNGGLINKLFNFTEEVSYEELKKYKTKIKNLATADELQINDKYIKKYLQPNFLSLLVNVNLKNSSNCDVQERRMAFFETDKTMKNHDWFQLFTESDENYVGEDFYHNLFHYLKNKPISVKHFQKGKPITRLHESNVDTYVQNEIRFLLEIFVEMDEDKLLKEYDEITKVNKRKKVEGELVEVKGYKVRKDDLYALFRKWTKDNNIKYSIPKHKLTNFFTTNFYGSIYPDENINNQRYVLIDMDGLKNSLEDSGYIKSKKEKSQFYNVDGEEDDEEEPEGVCLL